MSDFIPRHYADLSAFKKTGRVLVVSGPRRTGKTTLIEHFLAGGAGGRCLRASGDNLGDREILGSQRSEQILDWAAGYDTVFIDEAQRIENIGWALKILADARPELFVIATGSSSFKLSSDVGEPLTGRKVPLNLFPVSIGELRGLSNDFEIRRSVEDYLVFGMYPEVRTAQSSEAKRFILDELVQSYLFKDILELERVKSPKLLSDLLTLLAFQIGSEVSLNELSRNLKIDVKTVARYLDLLEKCFVLYNLRGFSRNLRNEVTKTSKYFFYDTGVRNGIIRNYNPLSLRNDAGALWENFMVMERLKYRSYNNISAHLYFWRTWEQQEIDLLEEYGGILHAVEFKWSSKKGKKSGAPSAFTEAYPDAEYAVIDSENFTSWV